MLVLPTLIVLPPHECALMLLDDCPMGMAFGLANGFLAPPTWMILPPHELLVGLADGFVGPANVDGLAVL